MAPSVSKGKRSCKRKSSEAPQIPHQVAPQLLLAESVETPLSKAEPVSDEPRTLYPVDKETASPIPSTLPDFDRRRRIKGKEVALVKNVSEDWNINTQQHTANGQGISSARETFAAPIDIDCLDLSGEKGSVWHKSGVAGDQLARHASGRGLKVRVSRPNEVVDLDADQVAIELSGASQFLVGSGVRNKAGRTLPKIYSGANCSSNQSEHTSESSKTIGDSNRKIAHEIGHISRDGEGTSFGVDSPIVKRCSHPISEISHISASKRRRLSSNKGLAAAEVHQTLQSSQNIRVGRRSSQKPALSVEHSPIEVDNLESPRNDGMERARTHSDEGLELETERARQVAVDEMLARSLQEDFDSEAVRVGVFERLAIPEILGRESQSDPIHIGNFLAFGSRIGQRQDASMSLGEGHLRGNRQRRAVQNSLRRRFQSPTGMHVNMRMELSALGMLLQESSQMRFSMAYADRDFDENDYELLMTLDESNGQHTGASSERIEQLPVSTIESRDTNEVCSICLENQVEGERVRRLPCMHGFHQQCIDMWLRRRANCPVCKVSI